MNYYLCYVRSDVSKGGVATQIRSEPATVTLKGQPKPEILQKYKLLPEQVPLGIDELKKLFPYKPPEQAS